MPGPELRRRVRKPQRAPDVSAALLLALTAVQAARVELDRIATATAAPAWQVVEAADLLDLAHGKLAAAKGSP